MDDEDNQDSHPHQHNNQQSEDTLENSSSNQGKNLPKIKLQTEQCNSNFNAAGQLLAQSTTTSSNGATKRLRTTITPEQLHFLYDCYQQESNPSRKMLEQIAKQVNLKKRVVQVWYQNSRARERKGQYRTTSSSAAANALGSNLLTSTGNLMAMMDSYTGVGGASGSSVSVDDTMKSPKLGDGVSSSDLGFLFNSFKQHY